MSTITEENFDALPVVEQNFRWDIFKLTDGYKETLTNNQLLELLRIYAKQYILSDVEINYYEGTDDVGEYSYWHYKERNGFGFSSPDTEYFVKDVIEQLVADDETAPYLK